VDFDARIFLSLFDWRFGAELQSQCQNEQRAEKGNVIIYLNYVKMFELPSDKSEFHGQFTRLRIKAIGAMIR
jgi:hypothetical protein